ncbi:unnamed protein product [Lepeophtheirus salmonis]|uniref:(salmon louse) hypothetical protein n=1 Tax=Lepeophtheirus salmonis TaxID=72036 RepID=A0A7R8CUE4_LEPSM|nr:unnamed protein product [Lepeophtheirus salmonis]CAF2935794.1 unnamed protein product [Lepeophtheirus salmonis]
MSSNLRRTCAISSCFSPKGVSYHRFTKDPVISTIWILQILRALEGDNYHPSSFDFIQILIILIIEKNHNLLIKKPVVQMEDELDQTNDTFITQEVVEYYTDNNS